MDKYKIDTELVAKKGTENYCSFAGGTIIAFTPGGSAIIRVTKPGRVRDYLSDDLCLKSIATLNEFYEVLIPKTPFFEVGKFYRWKDETLPFARYEIKEIFEAEQADGSVKLFAHAVRVTTSNIIHVMLNEDTLTRMVKM